MRPFFTPMPIRYVPYQAPPMTNRFFMPPNIPMRPPISPLPTGVGGMGGMGRFAGMAGATGAAEAGATGAAGVAGAASSLNFNQLFNQAGQFMQSAQKYGPMIQQARPMLKNIPALWKMYKGIISTPSDNQAKPERSSRPPRQERSSSSERKPTEYKTQPSLPKIYQPTLQSFDEFK